MTGRFGYDPDRIRYQAGGDYFPEALSAPMTARGSAGFALSLDARVISIAPSVPNAAGGLLDVLILQSFISESPNDWYMVIDFREPGGANGWLKGDDALPAAYPDPLSEAYLSIYFTDEYNWVRNVDARLLSVSPAAVVPLPAAAALFVPTLGMLAVVGMRRRVGIKGVSFD